MSSSKSSTKKQGVTSHRLPKSILRSLKLSNRYHTLNYDHFFNTFFSTSRDTVVIASSPLLNLIVPEEGLWGAGFSKGSKSFAWIVCSCLSGYVIDWKNTDLLFEMKKKKKSLKKGEIKRTVFTITKFASGCLPKDTKESSKSWI